MRALLVPIKAFATAKARLAPVLGASDRIALARQLAEGVLRAAGSLEAFVVCDDEEVSSFAGGLGARVIWTPGLGLSGAVAAGVSEMALAGITTAVVAHADLPRPARLAPLSQQAAAESVTIVPDRQKDGTNVICLPTAVPFTFSYGAGSFARHVEEGRRLALEVVVIEDDELSIDVDLPSDLAYLGSAS